jgi:hypothetical protein
LLAALFELGNALGSLHGCSVAGSSLALHCSAIACNACNDRNACNDQHLPGLVPLDLELTYTGAREDSGL